jgi:hypothetical protein
MKHTLVANPSVTESSEHLYTTSEIRRRIRIACHQWLYATVSISWLLIRRLELCGKSALIERLAETYLIVNSTLPNQRSL